MKNGLKINLNNQEKDLLLKDLCARLPYGVKIKITSRESKNRIVHLTEDNICHLTSGWWSECKPYLFPLSSMTEEQKIECFKGTPLEIDKYGDIAVKDCIYGNSQYTDLEIYLEVIDWLNANHFDFRGLIPMGLANDATGKNIY